MESVLKRLEIMTPDRIPFLFPGSGVEANKKNAFSKSIVEQKSVLIKSFISLMTMCDPKGLLYQKFVDMNLSLLLKNRVDIKSYFCSSMPIHRIPYNKFFVQYSEDDREVLIPCDAKEIHIIESNYKTYVEPFL
jgi:hypothetical protein